MTGMAPDDVVIEVDVDQDGTKSTARLKFRAYKHRQTEDSLGGLPVEPHK